MRTNDIIRQNIVSIKFSNVAINDIKVAEPIAIIIRYLIAI